MKNTIDPSGLSTDNQLTYLNHHNPIKARLAALEAHDKEFWGEDSPSSSYTEESLEEEMIRSKEMLGDDFPKFTGPNV